VTKRIRPSRDRCLRARGRAFGLDEGRSPDPQRDRYQEERDDEFERGEQRRVRPLARTRDDHSEDDEE